MPYCYMFDVHMYLWCLYLNRKYAFSFTSLKTKLVNHISRKIRLHENIKNINQYKLANFMFSLAKTLCSYFSITRKYIYYIVFVYNKHPPSIYHIMYVFVSLVSTF